MISHKSHGITLIEALVAITIVALGVVGIIKFQSQLFFNGAVAKQRSIATAIAQERMEELRGFISSAGYSAIAAVDTTANDSTPGIFGPSGGESFSRDGANFLRLTEVTSYTSPYTFIDVKVTVSWTLSINTTESVVFATSVAWVDPASAGILMSDPGIVTSGGCPSQTVNDDACIGTASATTNGQVLTISYTSGGAGSGQWTCTNGTLVKGTSTCSANCAETVVQDGSCEGTAPPTNHAGTASVTYTAGGVGSGVFTCNAGIWNKTSGDCEPGKCTAPWGSVIENGGNVTAYSSANPLSSCNTVSETRTCTNAVLSGTFTNQSCSEPCNGGTYLGIIASGSNINAYEFPTAATCTTQNRVCSNGTLSGTFQYRECTPTGSSSCTVAGITYNPGATRDFYSTSSSGDCNGVKKTFTCNGASGLFEDELGNAQSTTAYTAIDCVSTPCSIKIAEIKFNTSTPKFCNTPEIISPYTCTKKNDKEFNCTTAYEFNVGSTAAKPTGLKIEVGSGGSKTCTSIADSKIVCSTSGTSPTVLPTQCTIAGTAYTMACTVTP
ncbi:type IV pilus modification PilV family protein [Macromonas nakdongensis]|uniref:type IV pilus modification PilV family protein n=1 Tax=Macromonas nakdongensis TaxID=1843082 RepID=UPI0012FE97E8|nr:prepilin-type N-terminal cleavage/methylation domain-containing protein [Macromonas nakdongensis]